MADWFQTEIEFTGPPAVIDELEAEYKKAMAIEYEDTDPRWLGKLANYAGVECEWTRTFVTDQWVDRGHPSRESDLYYMYIECDSTRPESVDDTVIAFVKFLKLEDKLDVSRQYWAPEYEQIL